MTKHVTHQGANMARLSVSVGGEQKTFAVTSKGLQIGRSADNDVVLNDPRVSRRHAAVQLRGRAVWIADIESRNGIFVNRLRVREEQLGDGDIVQIGPFELRFEDRAVQSVVLDDSKYFPLASEGRTMRPSDLPESALDFREFYRITRRLNSMLQVNDIVDAVMDEVLRLVPAQRGVLMLRKNGALVPVAVAPPTHEDMALSSTIARKALDDHEAVLTRDARLDFAGSESVISANIRSALCVPLLSESESIGILYLDSPGRSQFDERQRDLLAAIANQAAINIERARLSDELRHQEQLRQSLERFMSPNVARLVASYYSQHGQLWEPQELCVSVLFADIKDFTPLSERLSPHAVQDLLNEYLHEMTDAIFQHGGTLDKYIGDGIMAVFGAPQISAANDPDQFAQQAVNAALAMIEAHRRLVAKLEPQKAFDIRIGVNTGAVYAGFFGTRQRLEYTVIGDTVNTASRLEHQADINSVLISGATRAAVGDQFLLEDRGNVALKGKTQPVPAFKVLGRTAAAGYNTARAAPSAAC
jgi:adenylate cyclase